MAETASVTALVEQSRDDPRAATRRLAPLVYDELRSLAARYMQRERRDHTLQPTALVNEAFLRLVDASRVDWQGKTHFLAVAAIQMRRVLTDHARARGAKRRGDGMARVTLPDAIAVSGASFLDAIDLEDALVRLARISPRQSEVVVLRFFGGLSVDETASYIGVSTGTVKGDWRVAKAWLAGQLSGG